MRLYFAHNFENRREFRKWELEFETRTGIDLLNPFYDAPERAEQMARLDAEEHTTRDRLQELKTWDLVECQSVVYSDLARIAFCDGLFTVIKKVSFGTTCEICHCRASCKPVFVVTDTYATHPWLRVYATGIWPDLDNFELSAKNGELEAPNWTRNKPPVALGVGPVPEGTWTSCRCRFCKSVNWYYAGYNPDDYSGIDIEALKCWNCGKNFYVDADMHEHDPEDASCIVEDENGLFSPGALDNCEEDDEED